MCVFGGSEHQELVSRPGVGGQLSLVQGTPMLTARWSVLAGAVAGMAEKSNCPILGLMRAGITLHPGDGFWDCRAPSQAFLGTGVCRCWS